MMKDLSVYVWWSAGRGDGDGYDETIEVTDEQYEVLKQYKRNLIMAHKSRQISALTSGDVLKLATVFEAEG